MSDCRSFAFDSLQRAWRPGVHVEAVDPSPLGYIQQLALRAVASLFVDHMIDPVAHLWVDYRAPVLVEPNSLGSFRQVADRNDRLANVAH
eukprot:5413607-Pyramimonas_sp.AAC.1